MYASCVRTLWWIAAVLALSGCASGYTQFYIPNSNFPPAVAAARRAAPPPAEPIVERSQPDSPARVLDAYARRGYVLIGSSSFNSSKQEPESNAVRQGVAVGADLVLIINPRYTGSVTSAMPITTPTTSTAYTTGSATAYGPNGPVTAYGSGTTTTYGTTTNYVPITINRSDYSAVYFVKQRFNLGLFSRDLNEAERKELQTNRGAVVIIVVDGTPAFNADLLVGDMILSVDGVAASGQQDLNRLLEERKGRMISLALMRGGTRIEKQIQLNR